ncbi:MAG: glucosidase [Chthoniobacteraceae bacterium]
MTGGAPNPDSEKAAIEKQRLSENSAGTQNWSHWGPYLSERQWGTVREDYSAGGDAWSYLSHDQARSRVYRWGEDGIAGFSDDSQLLCLSLALWNGADPILKERLFGLTNEEGNHGEDVKELYYYLDATPTHSYLKMLYKYPQGEFPYTQLVEENRRRGLGQMEFELLDTGLFDENRYFDVFIEYAKAAPDDLLMLVTACNRGPEAAPLWLLPQLWYRNTWAWRQNTPKPKLAGQGSVITAEHPKLGNYRLTCEGQPTLLFCENETNGRRLFGETEARGFFKDAFHDYLVHGDHDAVNPEKTGTKSAAVYALSVPPGGEVSIRLRLTKTDGALAGDPFADFDAIFAQRREEADAFYAGVQAGIADDDARLVQRQAFAGMIWSKQYYRYSVKEWLTGDPAMPPPPEQRKWGRNHDWKHLDCADVISMPDKWEYPWFAAWDLAFHCIPLALIDAEFAKSQLVLLVRVWYMHPNGQLPAYEWSFGDVDPPVHAWAAWRVFEIDRKQRRESNPVDPGDLEFLQRVFEKLLINFTWWVNRKDAQGRDIFQGGFLGLDNIACFNRSAPIPNGGYINQADGTSWMAMYCLNMMRISIELASHNAVYEDIATEFFEHFLSITAAINGVGDRFPGLWDEADQFYYDHLCFPDGRNIPLRVHSIVGLVPLFAVEVLEADLFERLPIFSERLEWYLKHRPELTALVSHWQIPGQGRRRLLALLRAHRMTALLKWMLDETGFLSDHGVRAVSKEHERQPLRIVIDGTTHEVDYWPGESHNRAFGGNSNWRGPVWMPINYLIIESLQKFHHYYGDDFKIEYPTGSGRFITLNDVAGELSQRLTRLFLKGEDGQRPVLKYHPKLAGDPHFRDYVLFHEYFDGDSGRGVGASHQTGWSGLVAKLIQPESKPD